MTIYRDESPIRQIHLLLIVSLAVAGMYFAAEFLQPAAALLLTFILAPMVAWLERL